MTKDPMFESFHRHNGPPWDPLPKELDDEYGDAYLAQEIKAGLQAIFSTPLLRNLIPLTKIHVVICARADTKVFAWPYSLANHEYILGINYGTFANISTQLKDDSLWSTMIEKSSYVHNLPLPDLYILAAQITINALAYHEIAHIIRGHLSYYKDGKNISNQEGFSRKELCEVDADKWSSYLLGGDVLSLSKGIASHFFGVEQLFSPVASEILEILAISLYRCFAVYNHQAVKPSTLYPHPLIRAIRVAVGAADNLETSSVEPSIALARLSSILSGLSYAEDYINDTLNLPQREWDIGKEIINFEANYSDELKNLEHVLPPFFPK
jgi:hypothetical protein